MFQDKCNRDYFQYNRNRLHLGCNRPMSVNYCFESI